MTSQQPVVPSRLMEPLLVEVGPITSGLKTIGTMDQIAPIDLGHYTGTSYTAGSSRIYFVPWVAPADGTLNAIEVYIASNSVSVSSEIGLGIYSHSSGPINETCLWDI